ARRSSGQTHIPKRRKGGLFARRDRVRSDGCGGTRRRQKGRTARGLCCKPACRASGTKRRRSPAARPNRPRFVRKSVETPRAFRLELRNSRRENGCDSTAPIPTPRADSKTVERTPTRYPGDGSADLVHKNPPGTG